MQPWHPQKQQSCLSFCWQCLDLLPPKLRRKIQSSGGHRPGRLCNQCWRGSSTPTWQRTSCFSSEMVGYIIHLLLILENLVTE
ncbi:hypothetical protein LDENG_00266710 [Lucifuga dentata]|nr:hypothetical protein LDENG_00266710 [Lucifuga dentata]